MVGVTNATARIGPVVRYLPNEYQIPDVSTDLIYGIEALSYADSTYSGTTTVALIVRTADNTEVARDEVKFAVAPFIIMPSTRPAEKFYVSDADTNFVVQLKAAVGADKVVEVLSSLYTNDVWVQDQAEIGYIQKPINTTMPVVWNLPRFDENNSRRPLDAWPKNDLRGINFGYFAKGLTGPMRESGGREFLEHFAGQGQWLSTGGRPSWGGVSRVRE